MRREEVEEEEEGRTSSLRLEDVYVALIKSQGRSEWIYVVDSALDCTVLPVRDGWMEYEWVVPSDVDAGPDFNLEIASVKECSASELSLL